MPFRTHNQSEFENCMIKNAESQVIISHRTDAAKWVRPSLKEIKEEAIVNVKRDICISKNESTNFNLMQGKNNIDFDHTQISNS